MSSYQVLYLSNFPATVPANESIEKIVPLEDLLKKYLLDYSVEDNFVIGYMTELNTFKEIITIMKDRGFAFSVRDSDVRQKQRGKQKPVSEKDKTPGEEAPNHTVFYQLRAMPIKFFGLPFTVNKTTHYHCAYGCKYYKSKSELAKQKSQALTNSKEKKKRSVGSKKMGCLAKMTLKNITVYPDYKLDVESDWRKKKKLIENLRADLMDGMKEVKKIQRYYLSVSIQSSHNHPPIFIVPKEKVKKIKKNLVRSKIRKSKPEAVSLGQIDLQVGGNIELDTFQLSTEGDHEVGEPKTLNLQDENFFHTLVKFPGIQHNYDEFKPVVMDMDMNEFDPAEETEGVVQIQYEYEGGIQYLQALFREKLKRLYSLSETCLNAPLLLKLNESLEQVELALNNDVSYTSV